MCRHFDLFFLGVKILLTSSVGGGVDIKWNGPYTLCPTFYFTLTV